MKTFIKISLTMLMCGLCMSAIAANRFIIKYKPNAAQISFLSAHGGADEKKAKAQIRVQMMEGLSKEKVDALSKAAGTQAKDAHSLATGAHVIVLSENLDKKQTEQFIRNVRQDSGIEYIEEDKMVKALSVPAINSAYQWDMVDMDEFSANLTWWGDNFVKAWNTTSLYGYTRGKNVVVAVVDTGYTPHPNFINSLQTLNGQTGVYGYKFISDCRVSGECPANNTAATSDPNSRYTPDGLDLGDFITLQESEDKNSLFYNREVSNSTWHGSHVTGIIVGSGYNSSNTSYMAGGANEVTVVPVRALGKNGGYTSDVINGMMWVAGFSVKNTDKTFVPANANPAHVICMSLGTDEGSCNCGGQKPCYSAFQDAINNVLDEGVVVVVAAGNDHKDIATVSPAGCSGVISVAAKGPTGKLARYSNYGNTTITASGGDSEVNFGPSSVYSTIWSSLETYQNTSNGGSGNWISMEGTSQATPHVSAAVAALIGIFKAQGKPYSSQEIIGILKKTATAYDNCNSYGCCPVDNALDANAAVKALCVPSPTPRDNVSSAKILPVATNVAFIVAALLVLNTWNV